MNKIYSGIIAIVAVVAVVAGSAYAAFSSQVTVNGITLGTTTAGLQIKLGAEPDSQYRTDANMEAAFQLAPLSPGQMSTPGVFKLRNSGTVDVDLSAQITHAEGDWNTLKDVMQGITCLDSVASHSGGIATACPTGGAGTTGWHTLSDWNTAPIALPGSPWVHGQDSDYYVSFYKLDGGLDNSYSGKSITNMQITIGGTQSATQTPLPTGTPE
jgi:hypothetical protein